MPSLCLSSDVPEPLVRVMQSYAGLGAAILVFRGDDSIAYANKAMAELYPHCDFSAPRAGLSSWYYSTLRAGKIVQREAIQDPDGWLNHITAARRMNSRLEFERTYADGKRVLCSHINDWGGWSLQVRVDAATCEGISAPNVAEAVRNRTELGRLRAIQDRVALGVAALRGDGTVVYCNAVFEDVLSQNDGLYLDEGTRLRAFSVDDERALSSAVHEFADERPWRHQRVLMIKRSSVVSRHLLSVSSYQSAFERLALIILTPPDICRDDVREILRHDFDLTPSQADLAVALASGMSAIDYASANGTSRETAYAQVKRAFKRLDAQGLRVSCQQSLVGLVSVISSISRPFKQ